MSRATAYAVWSGIRVAVLIGAAIDCAGLVFTRMRSLAVPFATAWATASAIVA